MPGVYKHKLDELFRKEKESSLTAFVSISAAIFERGMPLHGDVRLVKSRSHLQSRFEVCTAPEENRRSKRGNKARTKRIAIS